MRKLSKDDRLVGSARLCMECGVRPNNLAVAIACAMHYTEPTDEFAVRLQQIRQEGGYTAVLQQVCEIDPDSELGQLILEKAALIRQWGWIQ